MSNQPILTVLKHFQTVSRVQSLYLPLVVFSPLPASSSDQKYLRESRLTVGHPFVQNFRFNRNKNSLTNIHFHVKLKIPSRKKTRYNQRMFSCWKTAADQKSQLLTYAWAVTGSPSSRHEQILILLIYKGYMGTFEITIFCRAGDDEQN